MFDELLGRVAGRFTRVEPRRRVRAFVAGLLAELPRKNCWTIAEHAGEASPDGMQHLLARAVWDADAVRDDVRGYVVEQLADPDAVLAVDETGDLKKGTATVGVQRQYTGTAGRIENAQVGVYLTYAAPRGHALIDRELYLPRSWAGDPARCKRAGIPGRVRFATKPRLARKMIARALDGGTPAAWITGDETSEAVRLSSCFGVCGGCGWGEGGGFVVVLAGGQAVVQAAQEPVEQVALGGGVPVPGVAAAVVVGAGAG